MNVDVLDFTSVLRIEEHVAYLVLSGELDAFTASQVRRQGIQAMTAGCTHLRMDLGAVTFIDAAGINLLVWLRRTTSSPEQSFEAVAASTCVRRLCTLLGIAEAIGVEPAPWQHAENTSTSTSALSPSLARGTIA